MHLALSSNTAFLSRAFLLLVAFVSLASGNTEIRNFAVVGASGRGPRDSSALARSLVKSHLRSELHKLNATHNERTFRVVPAPLGTSLQSVCENRFEGEVGGGKKACLHELWLELDFSSEEWMNYERFTIRLSWPAFVSIFFLTRVFLRHSDKRCLFVPLFDPRPNGQYPTDFDIQLMSPEEVIAYIESRLQLRERELEESMVLPESNTPHPSRTMFARVRLVDTSVRSPSKSNPNKYPNQADQNYAEAVPFNIIVEPLLLGIIPATVVPTILFIHYSPLVTCISPPP